VRISDTVFFVPNKKYLKKDYMKVRLITAQFLASFDFSTW